MNHPLVSVIVPVYNGEATINRCIESLLAQDYPKERYEIIVVDNNSTDKTIELVRQYPVLVLEESKQGPAAARNRGLTCARGEIVAFIDADSFAEAQWLRELVKPFSDPAVGGVGGVIEGTSRATTVERYGDDKRTFHHQLSRFSFLPYLITGNAAFPKARIDSVGGFDENFTNPAGEDVDLSWRIQLDAPCTFVFAEKAVVYHKHRDTLVGLFTQSFEYRSATHKLHTKFSHHYSYSTRKVLETVRFYLTLVIDLPVEFVFRTIMWMVGKRSRDEMLYPFFEWIWRLGVTVGRLKCTLVHRRWYL